MAAKLIKLRFFDDFEDDFSDDDDSDDNNDDDDGDESKKDSLKRSNGDDVKPIPTSKKRKHSPAVAASDVKNSDANGEITHVSPRVQKPRLPLPSAFVASSASSSSSSDDGPISSADGRIRTFAHVRGNWASHVLLKPFEGDDETMGELGRKIVDIANEVFKSEGIEVHALPDSDLHLSLSRTFVLSHHLISSFASTLGTKLKDASASRFNNGNGIFIAFTSNVKIYFNDEKTRGFIAVQVDPTCAKDLVRLTTAVDSALMDFNLGDQTFYSDPSFHLSLAWFLPPGIATRPRDGAKEAPIVRDYEYGSAVPSESSLSSTSSSGSSIHSATSLSQSATSTAHFPTSSSSTSPLSPDSLSALEKRLSFVVGDHFREDDDDDADSLASTDDVASTAVWVKRALLKTGNQFHYFPL